MPRAVVLSAARDLPRGVVLSAARDLPLQFRTFALFACALLVTACAGQLNVPVPAVSTAAAPPPPLEAATIAIPVTIAMSTLRQQVEAQFPVTDSLDRARCASLGGVVCHQYVYRRDSLDLSLRADRLVFFTALRYRARVALPGVGGLASCGYAPDPMRRAEVRMSTTLFWRADWKLGSRDTRLGAQLLDPCEVTVLRVDAAPVMKHMLDSQLAQVRRQLDSLLPAVADLKPSADSLWRAMQAPIPLDSAGAAWLLMSPERVSLSPIEGRGQVMSSAVVLIARPRVVVGAKPVVTLRPLPALTLTAGERGIHVPVQIELPFADLSARVTQLMSGEVAGKGITVHDVKLWGVGDTAVVRVEVSGTVSGAFYLVGKVAYDSGARTLDIQDLRYTLASDNAMSRIKASLGAIRIKRALNEATGHGRLQIGNQLDSLRSQLSLQMNRPLAPGVALSGQMNDIRILGLYTTASAFVLRVVLDGEAMLGVQPPVR
ncbi:MAG: hypothetical protein JWO05_2258 [Gemmatimonadetes bacterium]|nr:hypothetical protein [Gemmatimonadota bacterium]